MTGNTAVGVSRETYDRLGGVLAPGICLVALGEHNDDVVVFWRRQVDRTAWVVEMLQRMPMLGWLHTDTAGVDQLPLRRLRERGVLLSNARGAHSPAVSEWALGAILLASKNLHQTVRDSDHRAWPRELSNLQLRGRTVIILGMGSIGGALAMACSAIGLKVVGISRSGRSSRGAAQSFAITEDWLGELSSAHFLVNCLPLISETRGLVGDSMLSALPAGAWFVNVGRGATVDEQALAAAARSGYLGGAILDTVVNEPLTASSPLWNCPNIIVSPHVSSLTDQTEIRTRKCFMGEYERFRRGLFPENLVDLVRGY